MVERRWGRGKLCRNLFLLILGFRGYCLSAANANDGVAGCSCAICAQSHGGFEKPRIHGRGTLDYGPPGLFEGFQGFGLGYHLGYGYGGDALGVADEGGYPFYGGPGYPHCEPRLRRLGKIVPFSYFGGPGFPTPEHPNFFGDFGPLATDRPVVTLTTDEGKPILETGYGSYTGAVPNAEALFAPFITRVQMDHAESSPSVVPLANTPTASRPGARRNPASRQSSDRPDRAVARRPR
jgi:hypothetical protein